SFKVTESLGPESSDSMTSSGSSPAEAPPLRGPTDGASWLFFFRNCAINASLNTVCIVSLGYGQIDADRRWNVHPETVGSRAFQQRIGCLELSIDLPLVKAEPRNVTLVQNQIAKNVPAGHHRLRNSLPALSRSA